MPKDDRESFADWWDSLEFFDEEGKSYESSEYDYSDRVWAIEYAYEHGWSEDEIFDMMWEDNADFWEWFRENYG